MEININGQRYDDWNQVPQEIRSQLAALPDADGNGIPDILEGKGFGAGGSLPQPTIITSSSINLNGQPINSLADLPPGVIDKITAAGFGAFLEPLGQPAPQTSPSSSPQIPAAATPPLESHQVMMNGQVVNVDATAQSRRRWWQFWK